MADVHSCRHHAEGMVEQAHRFYFHIQTIWFNGQNMFRACFSKTWPPLHSLLYGKLSFSILFDGQFYLVPENNFQSWKTVPARYQNLLNILVFWLVMRMLWRCVLYVLAFHDKPAVTFLINKKWSSVKQWQMSYLRKKSADKEVFVWTWTNNPMIEFFCGCFLKI